MFALFPAASTSRVSLVLLTVLLRFNNVGGTRIPFTLSSGPSLVKARICARDPVQQYFFYVPYGISTEAHAWHLGKEHTYLMNSGTPTITHFVEHSTRLYDCTMKLHFE